MKIRAWQWFLRLFGLFNLIPLVVLAITYYPPVLAWLLSFSDGMESVYFLRVACLLSVLVWVGMFLFRYRIDALIQWFLADLQRVNQEHPVGPMQFHTTTLNRWLMAGAVTFGLVALAVSLVDTHAYKKMINEDHFIEYASALSWFLAAVSLAVSLNIEHRRKHVKRLFYLTLIAFFIVCGGEEISWGQRLFGFTPAEVVQKINKQHEINLHNIGSISVYANLFFLLTLCFFVGIPWFLKRYPILNNYLRYYNAPVFHPYARTIYLVGLVFWVVIGIRFGTLGFSPFSLWGYYTQMDDEIFEFMAAYSFFSFAVLDLAYRLQERKALKAASGAGISPSPS